jgi:transcriptional regulator with XRE-family HTH domain
MTTDLPTGPTLHGASAHSSTRGDLANRVRQRRGALGLSKEDVAARARIDLDHLNRIESVPVAMTAGELLRLAGALDTNLADLLGSHPRGHSVRVVHE